MCDVVVVHVFVAVRVATRRGAFIKSIAGQSGGLARNGSSRPFLIPLWGDVPLTRGMVVIGVAPVIFREGTRMLN
jgi:hypothetical protein